MPTKIGLGKAGGGTIHGRVLRTTYREDRMPIVLRKVAAAQTVNFLIAQAFFRDVLEVRSRRQI